VRRFPPAGGAHVVVVDNDSRDGTVELVRRDFPEVELVAATSNLGFAKGTNLAVRRGSAPYVLALNPDTELSDGALTTLVALLDARPELSVAGCRLVRPDGSFDHAAKRSFPTPLSALGHFSGLGRLRRAPVSLARYRAPELGEHESGEVDAVNGAFMLMRRSALEDAGLFDEGYWMYMEDLDLCYRLRKRGHAVWYEASVTVGHVKAGTSGKRRTPRLDYAFHYGMLRFYRAHYAPERSRVLNAAVYVGIALKLLVSVARNAVGRR
jgi:GT2 family glycosyltransferase